MWKIFYTLRNLVIEALFPPSSLDTILQDLTPEDAYKIFPSAQACPIKNAGAIWAYKDSRVRRLIWSIKYRKSEHCATLAAFALLKKLQSLSHNQKPTIIIPVPITKQRRRERGFNQTELILEYFRQIPNTTDFAVIDDLLIRTQNRKRQTLKNRKERLESAQGIFSVNKSRLEKEPGLIDSKIILFDDVITTGSTMQEGLNTLKEAGFHNVSGLSIAH